MAEISIVYVNYLYYDSIAQLGEHYLDRVGVAGSSPVGIIQLRRLNPLLHKGMGFFVFLQIPFFDSTLIHCTKTAQKFHKTTFHPHSIKGSKSSIYSMFSFISDTSKTFHQNVPRYFLHFFVCVRVKV